MRQLFLCTLLVITFFFITCCERAEIRSQPTFVKDIHTFPVNDNVIDVVLYRGKYYCLKSKGDFLIIDSASNLVENKVLKVPDVNQLYQLNLRNDSLLLNSGMDNFYLNSNGLFKKTWQGFYTQCIFEDDEFEVTESCYGEWGGTIYFKDKKTGKLYECECTCVVAINKIKGSYVVTSSLAHGTGSTHIFFIKDPRQLALHENKFTGKSNKTKPILMGDLESKSKQGTIRLLDSIGIITLTSFIANNELVSIVANFQNTNICIIRDKRFVTIDTLMKESIWGYEGCSRIYGQTNLRYYEHNDKAGFLTITDNTLRLFKFNLIK
jgi:hypothetical protein